MNKWKNKNVYDEIYKIEKFIQSYVNEEQVVVAVSGGIDSDIVARLCCRSLGSEKVRLFIVIQSEMEAKFLINARNLAKELNVPLAEIHLEDMNVCLMEQLEKAEGGEIFNTDMFLNLAKAKCSVRTAVLSSYQDKGFLIAGTTNRTEKELGFLMTFGDNLAHFKPIAHLYKSELILLAKTLGTFKEVIEQEPTAGFWEGQTDLEDISYWIVNDGPIVFPRKFSDEEEKRVCNILNVLTVEKIDNVLLLYENGINEKNISDITELPLDIVVGIIHIVEKAKILKNRSLMVELSVEEEEGNVIS